ncbi:hypothetical protein, partial [Paeniglutamicibacter sulfureus]|uniref:hypothetical protein n=1 Tax=Paeniglutamicibacter sulfureus TaxID=43666 RepID=UPI0035E93D71
SMAGSSSNSVAASSSNYATVNTWWIFPVRYSLGCSPQQVYRRPLFALPTQQQNPGNHAGISGIQPMPITFFQFEPYYGC